MTSEDLQYFKEHFTGYCKSFYSTNPEDQKNILLKQIHTLRVCDNILDLASALSLNENRKLLAETVALFHDIGRFPQYARFRILRDSISINHGLLGAEVLSQKKILQGLPENEQGIVLESVKFHNAFSVPRKEEEDINFFIRLISRMPTNSIYGVCFLNIMRARQKSRPRQSASDCPIAVGRGADESFCTLLYDDALSDIARERLKVIYETADGFEVARRDLMMRGPGEFLGAAVRRTAAALRRP